MKYVLIPIALMLTACGQGFQTHSDPRTIVGVDPEFAPYVQSYTGYKGRGLNYDIPIQFADLQGNTVGLCTRWSSGERQIQIDRDYWNNYLDDGEKYEVIFHELGHCDLNRDHVSTTNNGVPNSIMYPYVFSLYSTTVANYMAELFNASPATSATSLASEMDCVHDIVNE